MKVILTPPPPFNGNFPLIDIFYSLCLPLDKSDHCGKDVTEKGNCKKAHSYIVCINTNDHQTSFPVLIIVIPSHAFMKYSQFASSSAPSFISWLRGAFVRDQNSGNTNPQCKERPALRISSHLPVAGKLTVSQQYFVQKKSSSARLSCCVEERGSKSKPERNQAKPLNQPLKYFIKSSKIQS